MGWCSATVIFDSVCDGILAEEEKSKKETLTELISALEDGDWDCQQDSAYWDHPLVREIMEDLHPDWFEDDEIAVRINDRDFKPKRNVFEIS